MPKPISSNVAVARRTRRSNLQHRHRNDLYYVLNHPTFTNLFYYLKYFFFKTSAGRVSLIVFFIGIFHMYFFSRSYWPKFLHWLHNSTKKS